MKRVPNQPKLAENHQIPGRGQQARSSKCVIQSFPREQGTNSAAGGGQWSGIIGRMSRYLGFIGSVSLILMMVLTTVDVVLRYFIGRPMQGGYEFTEKLMGITVASFLAYAAVEKAHVRVELLTSLSSKRTQAVLEGVCSFFLLVLMSLMIWQTIVYAILIFHDGLSTPSVGIPVFYFVMFTVVGLAVFWLVIVKDLFGAMISAMRK